MYGKIRLNNLYICQLSEIINIKVLPNWDTAYSCLENRGIIIAKRCFRKDEDKAYYQSNYYYKEVLSSIKNRVPYEGNYFMLKVGDKYVYNTYSFYEYPLLNYVDKKYLFKGKIPISALYDIFIKFVKDLYNLEDVNLNDPDDLGSKKGNGKVIYLKK